ncbi:hypothetical protein BLOT_003034 [Blomia tropicalis]|nr:hypothetical protein BLOT_003034 [Blomia tropicalis]
MATASTARDFYHCHKLPNIIVSGQVKFVQVKCHCAMSHMPMIGGLNVTDVPDCGMVGPDDPRQSNQYECKATQSYIHIIVIINIGNSSSSLINQLERAHKCQTP